MSRPRKALVLGLAVTAVALALRLTTFGLWLEEEVALGWLFRARGPIPPPPAVAIVSMDRVSAQQAGLADDEWPPPRRVHARVVRALAERGVSVVAIDILFDTTRSTLDDDELADALSGGARVVLVQSIERLTVPDADIEIEQLRSPTDQLQNNAFAVAPFPLPEGREVRFFWPFFRTRSGELPTLPAVALQAHALESLGQLRALLDRAGEMDLRDWPSDITSVADSRRLMNVLRRELGPAKGGARHVLALLSADDARAGSATDSVLAALVTLYGRGGRSYLNLYGPAGTITTIPFHRLLQDGPDSLPSLAGKVVFVGEAATQLVNSAQQHDTYRTVYSTRDGVDLSGAEIGATAFANLLTRRVIEPVGVVELAALPLTFGVLVALSIRLLPVAHGIPLAVLVGAGYFSLTLYLFVEHSVLAPLAIPLLVQLPVAMFVGLLARYRDIRRQVPVEVDPHAHRQRFRGVCLTTDVSGYTALASRTAAAELARLLEEYFDIIRRVVSARGGLVWGRGGDSSLCLWKGAAQSRLAVRLHQWRLRTAETDKSVRMNACVAAIELRDEIDRFNLRHGVTHQFRTRVGVDAGEVEFGVVGGELQVVGIPPNLASRIQELNKRLGTRLLASAAVVATLEGLLVRRLGFFTLPGIPHPVSIFEIVGLLATATAEDVHRCSRFEAALALYEEEQWSAAATCFDDLARTYAADGPVDYYRHLCAQRTAAVSPPAG